MDKSDLEKILYEQSSHALICEQLYASCFYDKKVHGSENIEYIGEVVVRKSADLHWADRYLDFEYMHGLVNADFHNIEYQSLGDEFLLQTAFFYSLLESRGVDFSNYMRMGKRSYLASNNTICYSLVQNYHDYVLILRSMNLPVLYQAVRR